MSDPVKRRCAGCQPGYANNVASLFPPITTDEGITFRYRCGTCRREWSTTQTWAEWQAEEDRRSDVAWARPNVIPGGAAIALLRMGLSIGGMQVLCGPKDAEEIERLQAEIGKS